MLVLSACRADHVSHSLACGTFRLHVGPLRIKVSSRLQEFVAEFSCLYADYPVSLVGGAYDFDIGISPPSMIRRFFRRNVEFTLSGESPFLPMQTSHAHALFEWGLNWAIAASLNNFLIIHSAVVEKNGCGVLLSATSGSGKSTLAAELHMSGWRLLSDELALVRDDLNLIPLPRPVSLKNESINLIQSRHDTARFARPARDTHKGTIGLMAPKCSSVRDMDCWVAPRLIVFPKWSPEGAPRLTDIGSGLAAIRLMDQSFNYPVLGKDGFKRVVALTREAEAWEIEYSSLDDAKEMLEQLVADRG